jgi:polyisoprenoid-binding protein YceI
LIAVTVRRGGALARFGHDHVIASRNIEGRAVAPANGQPGRTDFRFRLDDMIVDDSALRAHAGLSSTPSADAVAGTRSNMLTKALNAEKFPYVQLSATSASLDGPLQADITLQGVTRRYAIPAKLTASAAGLSASGALTIRQSDFGITPFAVFGGAIAVQDQLELRFDISATAGAAVSAPR